MVGKLLVFPENVIKSMFRSIDGIKQHFPETVKEYNKAETDEEIEKAFDKVLSVSNLFMYIAIDLTTIIQKEENRLDKAFRKKAKFFDVAKEFKTSLKDAKKSLDEIIADYQRADETGINRDKTISYDELDKLSMKILGIALEYAAEIKLEHNEWRKAIFSFHDGERDNLIKRYS